MQPPSDLPESGAGAPGAHGPGQNGPQPPLSPGLDRSALRRVLIGLTGLMVLGLVAASLWPAPAAAPLTAARRSPAPKSAAQPAPAPAAPAPPAPKETAVEPPVPPQPPQPPAVQEQPVQPLPARPDGEPSLLVDHGPRSCKAIALTYDAGSAADGAAAILDVLKKHGIHSTFFLTGRWVEKYPELARRIAAEGHEIANHTYSHPDLTKLPANEVLAEIKQGEESIRKITGKETRPLFREPYGAFNDDERRLVRKAGYSYSIYWDVDTLDWQFPGVEAEFKKLTTKTQNGSIVLMHLNVPDSATASDRAIPVLQEKGYKLVTVSQLLSCK